MLFSPELYSHIDKNSGGKSEHNFLVKIASKGTSLRYIFVIFTLQRMNEYEWIYD